MKDLVGIGVFLVAFAVCVFFVPTFGGLFLEGPNFEPANALSTPEHIAPVCGTSPRSTPSCAVPDQQIGALLMALSIICFIVVPWLDRSPVKSTRYRPLRWKLALAVFAVSFVALGYLGLKPATACMCCWRGSSRRCISRSSYSCRCIHVANRPVVYPSG